MNIKLTALWLIPIALVVAFNGVTVSAETTIHDTSAPYTPDLLPPQQEVTPTPSPEDSPTDEDQADDDPVEQSEPTTIDEDGTIILGDPTGTSVGAETLELTFEELGRANPTIIEGPSGTSSYTFRLPINWVVTEGGFIEFDLSFDNVTYSVEDEATITSFGRVQFWVGGDLITTYPLLRSSFSNQRIRVPVSFDERVFINDDGQPVINFFVIFDTGLCDANSSSNLTIHNTSFVSLNYRVIPTEPTLATYPIPFYQNSILPDPITYALPSDMNSNEAAGLVSIAAKLGDLSRNRMSISSTLDIDLVDDLNSPATEFERHLLVFGQPEKNALVPFLYEVAGDDLPTSLHERQMTLSTTGPTAIAAGQTVTYDFSIENNTDDDATLSLTNVPSALTTFVACEPDCSQEDGDILWPDVEIDVDETLDFSLTLEATAVITDFVFENNLMLSQEGVGPINLNTFTSEAHLVEQETVNRATVSSDAASPFFFTYRDEIPVTEMDGIVQIIRSPWSDNHAVLIVTGLNEEAIQRASLSLSSELRLPGLTGDLALVQESLPPDLIIDTPPADELTLEDLGYEDRVSQSNLVQRIDYDFFIPPGWRLTPDASVEVNFTHSEAFQDTSPELTLFINRTPISTIRLTEETASGSTIVTQIPDSAINSGRDNSLIVQVAPSQNVNCEDGSAEEFWLTVDNSSRISLDHRVDALANLDLESYALPFTDQSSLGDVLLALPTNPTAAEWEHTLRYVSSLGSSADGNSIVLNVVLGTPPEEMPLSDFHIVALGQPSRNPVIQQVNLSLPQPFLPGTDQIQQTLQDVVLRLLPGTELGYLQLIESPWNEQRALLAITGNSIESLGWSVDTLSNSRRLQGNLALVREDGVEAIDTRRMLADGVAAEVIEAVPELTQTNTLTDPTAIADVSASPTIEPTEPASQASSATSSSSNQRPIWLIPLVVVTALIVLAIFGFVFWQARR